MSKNINIRIPDPLLNKIIEIENSEDKTRT